MSMKRESRRRSPSIIARLMGMEELPLQLLPNKQQRGFSESYKQRTESVGPSSKSTSFESCSCRKKLKEEQEFKDVFEVVETKNSSVKLMVGDDKIASFRQKVNDAKRFSTDEIFQSSKVFSETLDVLEADKDLFLKCLQDPNSLYGKHLGELKRQHRESRCRRPVVQSTSEVRKRGSNDRDFGSDRVASSKNDITSCKKYNASSLLYPRHESANKAPKYSPLRSKNNNDKTTIPTRIVVLKPNLEMAQSDSKSFSSPPSLHSFPSNGSVLTELPSEVGRNAKLRSMKNVGMDDEISMQKSEETREIAKKVTRRMKNSLNTSSLNLCHTEFMRYEGDKSSSNASVNDFAIDTDVTTLASRKSFHRNERHKTSSHSSDAFSVNREAKKRLSEQWLTSHQFEEARLSGRRSTLGEVLALSDRKEKATMSDIMRSSNRYVGIKGPAERACSVGISSREGWKDVHIKNISKSRSLPASSSSFEGPKAGVHCVTHRADGFLMPKEAINLGRNKAVMNNANRKEGSLTFNSRSGTRKSKRCLGTDSADKDRAQEVHLSDNELKISFEEDDASEEKKPIWDTPICNMTNESLVVDEVVDVERENLAVCPEYPGHMVTEMSDSISVRNESTPRVLDSSFTKVTCGPSEESLVSFCHAVHEPESPAHSKGVDVEPDQPSPASVLEAPFLDDLSFGSECFGSLSADLQGLRMQLQLLKFVSEEYEEEIVTSSSGDDGEEEEEEEDTMEKVACQREALSLEKSCESSYIDDVLFDSGLDNADPDTFMACPVDHAVFLKLEKKYCDQTKWLRPERRLLFDRINMGITETLKQSAKAYPWVNPTERRVSPERTKDALHQLLESQEKKASNENTAEKVTEREVRWLDLEADVDVIGRDIEKALLDDLVVEFIAA